jgi:DNA topoisomerase VI subunit B
VTVSSKMLMMMMKKMTRRTRRPMLPNQLQRISASQAVESSKSCEFQRLIDGATAIAFGH